MTNTSQSNSGYGRWNLATGGVSAAAGYLGFILIASNPIAAGALGGWAISGAIYSFATNNDEISLKEYGKTSVIGAATGVATSGLLPIPNRGHQTAFKLASKLWKPAVINAMPEGLRTAQKQQEATAPKPSP